MSAHYYIGVDGGGSTLRVVLVNDALQVIASVRRGSANPNLIGRGQAATLIQDAVKECLSAARVDVHAAAIGVAGAQAAYAADWLLETLQPVLPKTHIFPSSDYEIALTGAMGAREGILLLAGMGSVAYGVNPAGEALQIGGWGYLLGDEGGGFAIGRAALQEVTTAYDLGRDSTLWPPIQQQLGLKVVRDIASLYQSWNTVSQVAGIASIVLRLAEVGDEDANEIVAEAANALVALVRLLSLRLQIPVDQITFAGSLLTYENALRRMVCMWLGNITPVAPRHDPVIGAALLAKLHFP